MNDFTKEELIDLLGCCKAAYLSGKINPQIPLRLYEQIQAIIDNYPTQDCQPIVNEECQHLWVRGKCHDCGAEKTCEHESNGVHYHMRSKSNSDLYIAPIWKCKKCGEFYK